MNNPEKVPVYEQLDNDLKAYVDRLAQDRHVSTKEALSDIIRVHRYVRDHQMNVKDRRAFNGQ
jgi:hypothetical protein